MNSRLQLKIKKRQQPQWLIWFIILYPFFFGTLIDLFKLPNAIKYLMDIAWIVLAVLAILNFNRKKISIEKQSLPLYLWVLAFFVFTVVIYIFNFQSPLYYLWGFRNNFRYYITFFMFILFLKKEDVYDIFGAIDVFFWINSVICFIQYFIFDIKRDHLGGLFGTEKGCNAFLNIFFVVIITKSIVFFLNKKENLWVVVFKCALSLLISAFAELKFFYIEFIIIIMISVCISNFSWRKLFLVIGGGVGVMLAISLLELLFPSFFNFFTLDNIIKSAYQGGYSSSKQLNRLTTIPTLANEILKSLPQKLFGLGLGNCDTSNFSFLTTPFYIKYSYLRYNWFSTAFLFLETGFFGLTFYIGFFIMIFFIGLKISKKHNDNLLNKSLCQISIISAVMAVLLMIYNSSLRMECGYIVYFMLSLPFILNKDGEVNDRSSIGCA